MTISQHILELAQRLGGRIVEPDITLPAEGLEAFYWQASNNGKMESSFELREALHREELLLNQNDALRRDVKVLRAEVHANAIKNARLHRIEQAAKGALQLAQQGRADAAFDVLNLALAGEPTHRVADPAGPFCAVLG